MKRIALILIVASAAAVAAGCGGSSKSSSPSSAQSGGGNSKVLVGAGSSLVAPLVAKWSDEYSKAEGVTIAYGPIGSGGGIAQITARTVDFGASDAPLTSDQRSSANGVVQIPWALAATVPTYDLHGGPTRLKLTGPVLADMFLGKITSWNDPRIAALNPGAQLPSTAVTPVYRSDSSGDTYALTSYLGKVSPTWQSKIGAGTEVPFPIGVGGKGNAGVAAAVSRQDGTIGYLAASYVAQNHLPYALLRNRAGAYPDPLQASSLSAAAAAGGQPKADNSVSLVDPPASARGAYPIATYTYALVPRNSPKAGTLKQFLSYAIGKGQSFGGPLQFAPLPSRILAVDRRAIAQIAA